MTDSSLSRRRLLALAAIGLAVAPLLAAPTGAVAAEPHVFSSGGLAIRGYDPVAYFTQSKPVRGSADHTAEWSGATWRFASAENKAAFEAAPGRYAPQFGGYCAWAVSRGYTASTEPDAWRIVDGKLYLNYSLGVRRTWSKDIPGNIAKGNRNWPAVLNK